MRRNSQRIKFENDRGISLAGILELPEQEPVAYALFSHCFTCTKDLKAIVRISRSLAAKGIAVLRFDFTGLGDSGGDFSHTTFHDNQSDVFAAIRYLTENDSAPQILIGHSLGGAAMIAIASQVDSARCVVNIASPSHTQHLARFLVNESRQIEEEGVGDVVIGGRTHRIRRPMVEALRNWDHEQVLRELKLPLLVLFSPEDETLPFDHGIKMFELAGGPTSFINLDGADHLLVNQPEDVEFVADMIASWSKRYLSD
ncbi:MAG: alpha/beta hydrolase [Pirellulaceae bacterium]